MSPWLLFSTIPKDPFQHSILGAARVLVGAVSNGVERGGGEAAGCVEEELARKACMGFHLV